MLCLFFTIETIVIHGFLFYDEKIVNMPFTRFIGFFLIRGSKIFQPMRVQAIWILLFPLNQSEYEVRAAIYTRNWLALTNSQLTDSRHLKVIAHKPSLRIFSARVAARI